MFRSKLVKGFIMGLGLAMALSTAAFAEEVKPEEAMDEEMKIQITSISEEAEAIPPDAPVSDDGQVMPQEPMNNADVSEPAQAADGSEVYDAELYLIQEDTAAIGEDIPSMDEKDPRIYMTAAPVSAPAETVNSTTVMAAIAAVVVLLGGTVMVTRRMKAAKGN